MPSQVTLTGGGWQDPHGNPVALGSLVLTLSQDALVTGTGQIAPLAVVFPLDSNGNLVASPTPSVWGNDNLTPSGTFYTAEVLNAGGSRVWGPEIWTLTGAGPINVGTIVPTTKSGGISVNLPTLQTNGTNNASQALLNLAAGPNITIVNSGSTDTISASVGALSTAGQGYFPSWLSLQGTPGTTGGSINTGVANTIIAYNLILPNPYTVRKITYQNTNINAGNASCAIYSADGTTKLVDAGQNAFNTATVGIQVVTITPVALNAGVYLFGISGTNAATSVNFSITTQTNSYHAMMNNSVVRIGTAANALSSGAMPSSLGALTAINASGVLPGVLFEV